MNTSSAYKDCQHLILHPFVFSLLIIIANLILGTFSNIYYENSDTPLEENDLKYSRFYKKQVHQEINIRVNSYKLGRYDKDCGLIYLNWTFIRVLSF